MQPSEDRNDEDLGRLEIQKFCKVPLVARDDDLVSRY